jgi:hypothetical protein
LQGNQLGRYEIETGKEREVRVGDVVGHKSTRYLGPPKVTKVTAKYIWLEYADRIGGEPFIVKRRRDIILIGTKYY